MTYMTTWEPVPLLGGLTRLDCTPGGGLAAGILSRRDGGSLLKSMETSSAAILLLDNVKWVVSQQGRTSNIHPKVWKVLKPVTCQVCQSHSSKGASRRYAFLNLPCPIRQSGDCCTGSIGVVERQSFFWQLHISSCMNSYWSLLRTQVVISDWRTRCFSWLGRRIRASYFVCS
jgi:hypothetical protein